MEGRRPCRTCEETRGGPERDPFRSIFHGLGALLHNCSAFPWDSPEGKAFEAAGGQWVAVQFGDPNSHDANVSEFVNAQWHLKWITRGVKVLGWHRVEHTSLFLPPHPQGTSGWLFNAETEYELERLQSICGAYRLSNPTAPMGIVPMGKQAYFPTGLLETLNAFLLPECFTQEGGDHSITNSVEFWIDSGVRLGRINPMIEFKPGIRTDPTSELNEQLSTGAWGLSTFTGENTHPDSWNIIGGYRGRIYVPR